MDFSGKIVLVTGASRGIGRSCAVQFAAAGATIVVHYNANSSAADETISMLAGEGHITIGADMADADAVKTMVDSVIEQMGRIDILVNNAGIYEYHKIAEVDYETWQASWQRILDVNLIGVANTIFCAAQYMIKAGGGRIVNVSSRGAFRGEPDAPAYGASKAGMNSMGQSLAKTLAPHNIYIGTVAPGWVMTDMAADLVTDEIKAQSPLNRIATPDEIAHAVLFLASKGAEFATGAIIDVNGASYLRS